MRIAIGTAEVERNDLLRLLDAAIVALEGLPPEDAEASRLFQLACELQAELDPDAEAS